MQPFTFVLKTGQKALITAVDIIQAIAALTKQGYSIRDIGRIETTKY